MNDSLTSMDFINYPYKELEVKVPRRLLFQLAIQELHIFSQPERQDTAFKLSTLGELELGKIKTLVPVIIRPFKVIVLNGAINILDDKNQSIELCPADEHSNLAIKLMDGKKDIAEIAGLLSRRTGLSEDKCSAYVRGLFLTLVSFGVCMPKNNRI